MRCSISQQCICLNLSKSKSHTENKYYYISFVGSLCNDIQFSINMFTALVAHKCMKLTVSPIYLYFRYTWLALVLICTVFGDFSNFTFGIKLREERASS